MAHEAVYFVLKPSDTFSSYIWILAVGIQTKLSKKQNLNKYDIDLLNYNFFYGHNKLR